MIKMGDVEKIILELALNENPKQKEELAGKIFEISRQAGVYPASINRIYQVRGRSEIKGGFTVPAINLRTLTYDLARAIFRVAKKKSAGTFIFEIARTEMGYTNQSPMEYVAFCLGAAISEGFSGPVFIQGDHFQVKQDRYSQDRKKEMEGIKSLIRDAVKAGFYNIDIDSSTLVDLSKPTVKEQQRLNYEVCAELTRLIRDIQPQGIEVSVGGEIGEIGGKNSTPEELRAFIEGYKETLGEDNVGISKISVQTGTAHGGVVLPDGTIAKVKLDFDTLMELSKLARVEFGLAGAVQHGASTLPREAFNKFPETETAEVHLATQFQNIIYESKHFPSELRNKIYDWIKREKTDERKKDQTEEQFIYKTRKKALGPFKKDILSLPVEVRRLITEEVEAEFEFLFDKLNVVNTKDLIAKYY
ncbi:MAG: class II fructose-bisphosphate aldolase [Candidatus Omnitrophota bacterium]|nr:class II fructose-bisphosphate aldolase [Candidatus Omnitrophota bacterium]